MNLLCFSISYLFANNDNSSIVVKLDDMLFTMRYLEIFLKHLFKPFLLIFCLHIRLYGFEFWPLKAFFATLVL